MSNGKNNLSLDNTNQLSFNTSNVGLDPESNNFRTAANEIDKSGNADPKFMMSPPPDLHVTPNRNNQ